MSVDLINNLLDKLKKKTGREWKLSELMILAKKLPDLSSGSIDAVIQELNEMGVNMPSNAKERVEQKLKENPKFPLEDYRDLSDRQDTQEVRHKIKGKHAKKKSEPEEKRSNSKISQKKSLFDRILKLQKSNKKRKIK